MLIDITLRVTPELAQSALKNGEHERFGHLGTHFDVMDQEFPLDYFRCPGLVFDVSGVEGREIGPEDIALDRVEPGMFVAFHTGFIHREPYGSPTYLHQHPQLSRPLIQALVERRAAIIGVDMAGVRRGPEHGEMDRYCASRGVFIVENLWGLAPLLEGDGSFTAYTAPLSWAGLTGLPCRVLAEKADRG